MSQLESNNEQVWRSLVDPTPIRIQPFRGWQMWDVVEFWRYRELLLFLTWRDIRVRYRQTVIGAAWAIIQPLCMVAVLGLFLGKVTRITSVDVPYSIFAFCGLLPWLFFASAVNNSANSVLNSEKLVTKVYFPRIMIPLAATGSAIVDLLVAATILLIMLLAMVPGQLGLPLLMAPLLLLCIGMTAIGVGAALASLNVAYRDFKFVLPLMMQLWLFATPSIYLDIRAPEFADRISQASPLARWALQCNPLVNQIAMFREALLGHWPAWPQFGICLVTSIAIFLIGVACFRGSEHRFADII